MADREAITIYHNPRCGKSRGALAISDSTEASGSGCGRSSRVSRASGQAGMPPAVRPRSQRFLRTPNP